MCHLGAFRIRVTAHAKRVKKLGAKLEKLENDGFSNVKKKQNS